MLNLFKFTPVNYPDLDISFVRLQRSLLVTERLNNVSAKLSPGSGQHCCPLRRICDYQVRIVIHDRVVNFASDEKVFLDAF